jgi:hypothetical protein
MDEEASYEPKDAVQAAIKSTLITGSAGLLLAAVQNTLARQNIGALGVFTRFGGTIGLFGLNSTRSEYSFRALAYKNLAGVGGTYAFVSTASANLREKRDPYNQALGGFCAGSLLGLRSKSVQWRLGNRLSDADGAPSDRRMSSVLGCGVLLAVTLAAAQYTGNSMLSDVTDPDKDRYLDKAEIRNRFRRPVNELINEIGEGRGTLW